MIWGFVLADGAPIKGEGPNRGRHFMICRAPVGCGPGVSERGQTAFP